MTLNDQFIQQTAQTLSLPEEDIRKVVAHQWRTGKEATLTGSIVEFSGLGRLQVRIKKVQEYTKAFTNYYNAALRELEPLTDTDPRWYPTRKKLKGLEKDLAFLHGKKDPKPSRLEKHETHED